MANKNRKVWKVVSRKLLSGKQTWPKSDHEFSEADYDRIIEHAKSILPKGNKLKENFYVIKSMIKPLSLGYQKKLTCVQTSAYYIT